MKSSIEILTTLYQILMILAISVSLKEIKFGDILLSFAKYITNQKLLFFIYSNVIGFLPIPGRITATCALNDVLIKVKNEKLSYLSYISTHHYYLWSPIEKSIIIILSALSIGYTQFLQYASPLILSYFILLIASYIYYLNDNDISIRYENNSTLNIKKTIISLITLVLVTCISIYFKSFNIFLFLTLVIILYANKLSPLQIAKKIEIKLLMLVFTVMIIGLIVKNFINVDIIKSFSYSFYLFLLFSFALSLVFGSSSKYAAIVSTGCLIYGIDKLPILLLTEFAGYLLSPLHKCNIIASGYFGTKIITYYKRLLVFVIAFAILSFILLQFKN